MTHETVANQIVMGTSFWIATIVFLLAYGLIIWDKIHKTIIALFGAAVLIVVGILSQEEAFTFHRSRCRLERDLSLDRHDGHYQYHEAYGLF